MSDETILKRGAEAVLRLSKWHGRDVVVKERLVKTYRHPAIDGKLRAERLKMECRLFRDSRKAGIAVPLIYDIDLERNAVVMEYIPGMQAKEFINSPERTHAEKCGLCVEIGRLVGKLHFADISHGDLTTSNMLVAAGDENWQFTGHRVTPGDPECRYRIYLIDLSMGSRPADIEKKGVDMHLLKEAFQSAHSENFALFQSVLEGYREVYTAAGDVIKKVSEIEERGRYARDG